jgi:phosphoenolpyruvate carboxykinase (ATP)
MPRPFDLTQYGLTVSQVLRNVTPAVLYEHAVKYDRDEITASGAIATDSGSKKGRSPEHKRVVREPMTENDVWWGKVNIALPEASYQRNREVAIEFLNTCERLYVVDGFAGWDPASRISVRVVCSRPYHALFMQNMLIRPSQDELADFCDPDYVIFNAGCGKADRSVDGVTDSTVVALNFAAGELVILGTEYAGEMKKGVFTIMNYLMPKRGILSMHCSANEGPGGDVSLFFGLSGTGKTTLSADPHRDLIGDDEHCWNGNGVFNIEGGCYAKCINLSETKEPEIYHAIRFGTILENTVQDPATRKTDYSDGSHTENTRASYPIEFIPHAKIPCVGGHPSNIVFLACDAYGVLPPVSRLTPLQAMYHFISGYTARVAGTEVGVTEPAVTFSACFGAPFLVWHPAKYAELLADQMHRHKANAWLVNTGWSGGACGTGQRISIPHTRAIIDAIHDGNLANAPTETDPVFGLEVPTECAHVPRNILIPRLAWNDREAFDATAARVAQMFVDNFEKFAGVASVDIKSAGPKVPAASVLDSTAVAAS